MPDTSKNLFPELSHNVPLPGAHTGRRIIEMDLGGFDGPLQASSGGPVSPPTTPEEAQSIVTWIEHEINLVQTPEGYAFNAPRAVSYWLSKVLPLVEFNRHKFMQDARRWIAERSFDKHGQESPAFAPEHLENEAIANLIAYVQSLRMGIISIPVKNWSGDLSLEAVSSRQTGHRLFAVEVWGISSFPENYGVGKTVKTLTLLPGESLRVKMRTWRATKHTREAGSSIVDSHSSAAASRFAEQVIRHTGAKNSLNTDDSWYVAGEAKASWGIGSMKVSGGAEGKEHAGREEFADQAMDATREHVNEASAAREMTVTSSSEETVQEEDETVVERTISNVNMRRTLNYVFRELNQEYTTKIHLKEIRFAYTNGKSWYEMPASALYDFLKTCYENENDYSQTFQLIMGRVGMCFDHHDEPVNLFEILTYSHKDEKWVRQPYRPNKSGWYIAPSDNQTVRFARGFLNQPAELLHRVPGVVVREFPVVLRTDSLVVEALLGTADALDNYAMKTQEAESDRRLEEARAIKLENDRIACALKIIETLPPTEKVEAYTKLFPPAAACDGR